MSDTTPTADPIVTEPNGDAPEVDYKAKYEEAIGHSRDWEKRAKQNKEAADELEQLREAQKSAEQKQAEKLADLERENQAFKLERQQQQWASEVAEQSGVPAAVLRGSTLEEIQAHADALKPAFVKAAEPKPVLAVPTIGESPALGNVSLPDRIAAAEAAGDKATVAALKAQQLSTVN